MQEIANRELTPEQRARFEKEIRDQNQYEYRTVSKKQRRKDREMLARQKRLAKLTT